jgi:sarcosine oxidase
MTTPGEHVAVIGAGAFGVFAARELLARGARVTLLDAWGAGNARASSGGETRILRAMYGADRVYVEMAARSLALWRALESRAGERLFTRTGALWLVHGDASYVTLSMPVLRELGLHADELTHEDARHRYPQMSFEDVERVVLEREAGPLLARRACALVAELVASEGGEVRRASARPGTTSGGRLCSLVLSDGSRLEASQFVFACGPWLGQVFPELLGSLVVATRQEDFTFGTPPGDDRFHAARLPVFIELGPPFLYGVPGDGARGLKVADDARGARFEPTNGQRLVSAEGLAAMRAYLARRFPDLAKAPLLEGRVCQYEQTPDGHLILDRHPELANVFLAGGGSGHGFKHAPAVGEIVADTVLRDLPPDPRFSLARFAAHP